jgi:hypothetical protein
MFSLGADMVKLKCTCGQSEMTMVSTDDDKVRLTIPCLICPKPHTFSVSRSIFFGRDLFVLPCPYADLNLGFIGEMNHIKAELARTELELLELLMANPEEHLDLQKLSKCIGNYGKSLNNGKWLGKYAGFEEKKIDGVTCYCFQPDVYEFTRESVTYLEDAFRNAKDYADLMTDLKKAEHDLRNKKFSLVLGVKDGVLSFAEIQTAAATAVRLDIAALGYTKINPTQLEEMLDRAITLG